MYKKFHFWLIFLLQGILKKVLEKVFKQYCQSISSHLINWSHWMSKLFIRICIASSRIQTKVAVKWSTSMPHNRCTNYRVILELEGALVVLLAQTHRDCKETRAPFRTLALNMKYTIEFVFIWTLRDAVLSTYKMAGQTHTVRCCFVNLENGLMHACRAAHIGQCAL